MVNGRYTLQFSLRVLRLVTSVLIEHKCGNDESRIVDRVKKSLPVRALIERRWTRFPMFVSVCMLLVSHALSGQAAEVHHRRVGFTRRLLAPFRSNPFLQKKGSGCGIGLANCLVPHHSSGTKTSSPEFNPEPTLEDSTGTVTLELRTAHRGPFAHHWLELESLSGKVTIGFGPATVPFIDAGQIELQDEYGNIERISGMHPLPWLGLPPVNYRYARAPGDGHRIGKPITLTIAQSEALIKKVQHMKFVVPYIPIFHDCRTYACTVQASARGRSTLPCYLLFKGYW